MIKPYYIQIAAVRFAARLLGRELQDNYGFHGALARFTPLELGEINPAEGLEDVPAKAQSFKFGQHCGRILYEKLGECSEEQILAWEARIARETFLTKLTPQAAAGYTPEQLRDGIATVFRALFKRAQIRTHTAKPGSEDINAWLADYNRLAQDFDRSLSALVEEIVAPSMDTDDFFDRNDPLIALATGDAAPSAAQLRVAVGSIHASLFGEILREIVVTILPAEGE